MDELKKKEQKQISELLFKYFIMNDKYIAVQMPDGKYIPKKVFCSPQLVYDMLMCGHLWELINKNIVLIS